MYSPSEAEAVQQRNYHQLREMIRVTYTVGYNIRKPGRYDRALRLALITYLNISLFILHAILLVIVDGSWSVVLILSSLSSFYGHWQLFMHYYTDIPRITETLSTMFQAMVSIAKILYFLAAPRKFYKLLRLACRHELLLNCELFETVKELPISLPLRQQVDSIMNRCWINTRRQLLFYLYMCVALTLNYFLTALVITLYRYFTLPRGDFEAVLPFPSLYPNWTNRGMAFPYYHVPLFLETCSLYLCGMGTICFDVLFIVLCRHGVGLMKVLSYMIECSTSTLVPREHRVQYMRCCLYQYQRVAAFAADFNDSFKHIIIIQFLLSLLMSGLVLFQMSIGLGTSITVTLRMLMYLAAGGYQIVIYCYNGQSFATASEEIPRAFYNCVWYEESREFRQLINMMILRTNYGFSLDVSWFTKMSLPTLLSLVRTSGQYYLLLQNLMQK